MFFFFCFNIVYLNQWKKDSFATFLLYFMFNNTNNNNKAIIILGHIQYPVSH